MKTREIPQPRRFEWLSNLAEAMAREFPSDDIVGFISHTRDSQASAREKRMLKAAFEAALTEGAK